jgi:outer membrane protein assembly factor BamB
MFGLTEITALSDESVKLAIIPTVVLPFALVSVAITSIATSIAAFFGYKLKAEGPKRLLEVLLKPRILISAVLLNAACWGAYQGYIYFVRNAPWPLALVKAMNFNQSAGLAKYNDTDFIHNQERSGMPFRGRLELEWQSNVGGPVFGDLLETSGRLFVSNDSGTLSELDASTGKILRRFRVGQPVSPAALIIDNVIYFGEGEHDTHHARMYAFDLNTGKSLGAFATKGHIERAAIPAKIGSKAALIFGAGRDGVFALEARTLTPIWQWSIGHVDTPPVIDGDTVFVGSGKERGDENSEIYIAAVRLSTGKTIWQKKLSSSAFGSAVVWKDQICYSLGDVERATAYGQFACYSKEDGDFIQSYNVDGALLGRPLVHGDTVTLADVHGGITRIDLKQRRLLWTFQVPTEKMSFASIVTDENDNLIYPTTKGLAVFAPGQRKEKFLWKPPVEKWKGAFTNVLRLNDRWVFADKSGNVFGLKVIPGETTDTRTSSAN